MINPDIIIKTPNDLIIKTEDEIKNDWIFNDKIYISVICLCFNQETYIETTIRSFLSQEVEYKFEIIVHDDCSTDNTSKILDKYKKEYPSIIKIVKPEKNLYSTIGMNNVLKNAIIYSKGDYISLCEGDDYWIDKHKLHKQIRELEENKKINIVISRAISLYPNDTTAFFCDLGNNKKIISFKDCIIGPKKDFFPTATFFIRREVFLRLPDWYYTLAPVGDYYIQLFASKSNGAIYLPDATSVYRRMAIGSYNSKLSLRKKIAADKQRINCGKMLLTQSNISNFYSDDIKNHIFKFKISLLKNQFRNKNYISFINLLLTTLFTDRKYIYIKLKEKI